ncbi:LysR family transcriptional regulator [Phreatobacter stygius]|uniref:LysR family transcriptional regulator n=1 Tax=Phreatobacter stygius TaxID=1940610 RepID=A0A4D7B9H2_9HYPH|nr:LysR family transcriptional regulator [Phreatobacter stygius]QCI67180.1 LysR family transcriptional regulator [Phreatobacter stygius]
MDLKQLKTFIRVAETGSLSKASDRLRLAQPALSRQIKLLEAEIGMPLFIRYGRGMQMTEAGQELLARVAGLVHQLETSIDDVRSLRTVPSGTVALGMMPTVSYVLAARLARRVAAELPGISLRIVEGYAGHLVDWLHRGDVDATLLYGPSSDLHLRVTDLLYEELVLVGPSTARLDAEVPMPVAALAGLELVLPSRSHGLRAVVETAAQKARIDLTVRFEADSFRVLKDLVEAGLGYTVLPISAIRREERAGLFKTAPLEKPKVTRQIILALPSSRTDTRATRALVDLVIDEIATLVANGDWVAVPSAELRGRNGSAAPPQA